MTSVVTAPRGIVNHTVVSYAPAYDASGATLIAAIPGASWVVGRTSLGSTLEVYVGSDFPTVVKPTTGSNASATASPSASAPGASATPTTIAPITANTDICTASKRR